MHGSRDTRSEDLKSVGGILAPKRCLNVADKSHFSAMRAPESHARTTDVVAQPRPERSERTLWWSGAPVFGTTSQRDPERTRQRMPCLPIFHACASLYLPYARSAFDLLLRVLNMRTITCSHVSRSQKGIVVEC
jgi:hypothetical protein